MSDNSTVNVSQIDKAINAAKARKATRTGSAPASAPDENGEGTAPAQAAAKVARPKMTDAEKAAKQAARDAEKAAKKAERDAARTQKRAEKDAGKAPAHMKKVQAAASKLGNLTDAAQLLLNEITATLPAAQVATLPAHLTHFNRVKATERSLAQKLEVGQQVTIVGGEPRYLGKVGTLSKVQRIRAYVEVPGIEKAIYVFTADVAPIASAQATESATG